jgi:hypothetical protein
MDWMIEYCRTEAEDALKRGCRTEAENERASLSWNEAADRLEKFKEGIGEEVPQTKRCHSLILQLCLLRVFLCHSDQFFCYSFCY